MGLGTPETLGRLRLLAGAAAMTAIGCTPGSTGAEQATSTESVHHKPQAPVSLELTSLPSASDHWVTAVASPTIDTPVMQVTIFGPSFKESRTFKNVLAGSQRTFRVPIKVGGGAWVRASARVHIRNGFAPNRVAEIAVGTPPPRRQAKPNEIILPTGERIDEVR